MPVGDVTADESIRPDTSYETLSKLKPVFDPEGTTTAGNAPGINDGATCVVVCSEEFAKRLHSPFCRSLKVFYCMAATFQLRPGNQRWRPASDFALVS